MKKTLFLLLVVTFLTSPCFAEEGNEAISSTGVTKEQAIAIAKKVAARAEKNLNFENSEFKAEFVPNSNYKDTFHPFVAKSKDFDDKTGGAENLMNGVEKIAAEQSALNKKGYWRITYSPKGKKFEKVEDGWKVRTINVDSQSGDTDGPMFAI